MAVQSGEVRVGDRVLGYFQFSRTVGIAHTRIYPTLDAVKANWRTKDGDRKCSCPDLPRRVMLWTDGYDEWVSRACLDCLAIVGNPDPTDNTGAFLSQCYSDEEIDEMKREWGWID